jgi:hypothetical protein
MQLQLRWNISCSYVLRSHATVANATLPGHKQRGWDSLRHDLFFCSEGVPKLVRQESDDPRQDNLKKDSEKSNDKRGA